MNWSIVMNVLFVVLIIAAIVLGVLYYFGRKLEKRQVEAQATIDAAKQVVTLMAIDKKKLKLKEAGLPAIVYEQTPWYAKRAKIPVVKAKIGPRIMTMIADEKVFLQLPLKTEAKVVISGMYITEIKSVRGRDPASSGEEEILRPVQKEKGRSEKERIIKDSASSGEDLQVMRFLFSRQRPGLALTPGPFPAGYPRWSSLFPSCPARRSHPYGAWSPPAYCR